MTVGRRPGPPVVVRTSVTLISSRLSSIRRADWSGARANAGQADAAFAIQEPGAPSVINLALGFHAFSL